MVLLREMDLQKYIAKLSKDLKSIPGFTTTKLFMVLDDTKKNYLVESNFSKFVRKELKVPLNKIEAECLFRRFDKDYDCKVTLNEFQASLDNSNEHLLT